MNIQKILQNQPTMVKAFFATAVVGAMMVSSGCQKSVVDHSYTQTSLSEFKKIQGAPLTEPLATQVAAYFATTFEALGTPEFNTKAHAMFADQFYLNDTLAVHRNKASLMEYFIPMNKRVANSKVVILAKHYSGDSLYLHWTMEFDFSIFGKVTPMLSSGVTHLKVNPTGQIIYQQDYWDPNNGLYRNLPMIGWLYRTLLPMH